MKRLSYSACPCVFFFVIRPVFDFADLFLPGLAVFLMIRAVFDQRFDLVVLQIHVIFLTAITDICNDGLG